MNPELLVFPSSLVGARPRPRRLLPDPFSSPTPSWEDVPEADSEAVPMAPLRRRRTCFFDDGLRSEIREGDLANMRTKRSILFLRFLSFSTYSPYLEDFNSYPSSWGTSWISVGVLAKYTQEANPELSSKFQSLKEKLQATGAERQKAQPARIEYETPRREPSPQHGE
ncbi:hypothetical protein F2Q69_00036278 [Brassica cretica]|uniref:Uncharacterized protein n=1 Tax=Brassica cretica TaxID=69181 RepID=A0A8S9SGJ3_BRACR|nr:hypothetical protein F2Q69_00036278 [Brassica cretica]